MANRASLASAAILVVNFLNWRHGPAFAGFRRATVGVNLALLAVLWAAGAFRTADGFEELLSASLPVALVVLSVRFSMRRRPVRRDTCAVTFLTVILLYPTSSVAQQPPRVLEGDHVTIVLGAATVWSEFGDVAEAAMRDASFADTTPQGFWGGGESRPTSPGTAATWFINVRVPLRGPYGAGVLVADTDFGTVFGYRSENLFMHTGAGARIVAPLFSARVARVIYLGGGPAFVRTRFGGPNGVKKEARAGGVLFAEVATETFAHMFVVVHGEFRWIGRVENPPQTVSSFHRQATFPALSVTLSHWVVGGGLGIRF